MKKTKKFILKKDKIARLYILSNNEKEYMVLATNEQKQVGYCYFSLSGNECKIVRIAVTDQNFLSTGLGSAMFCAMEQFAYQQNKEYITGVFIARGYPNASEMTSKFYKKHGFIPEDDDFLDREEISKKITPQTQFEVPVVQNEKLYKELSHYNFSVNDMFSSGKKEPEKEPQLLL